MSSWKYVSIKCRERERYSLTKNTYLFFLSTPYKFQLIQATEVLSLQLFLSTHHTVFEDPLVRNIPRLSQRTFLSLIRRYSLLNVLFHLQGLKTHVFPLKMVFSLCFHYLSMISLFLWLMMN